MNDKTLGEYKRTTPDPDETTGEALARLQAEMTRLLDEADAELRDEADGGVAAALIEKEADTRTREHLLHEESRLLKLERSLRSHLSRTINRAEKAERERDEARGALRARLGVLAESRPLTPDAMTAREHLDAAWEAAHVPADGTIPAGAEYIMRSHRTGRIVTPAYEKAGVDLPAMESTHESRLLDPPAPAHPEGAEQIAALVDAWKLTAEPRPTLPDFLASRGVRVVGEERS